MSRDRDDDPDDPYHRARCLANAERRDADSIKHSVVRVITSQPELLIAHLAALGASVPVPLADRTVMLDGRPHRQLQASVDLPPHEGVALHLIVAGGPVGLSVEEFRQVLERKRAAAGGAGGPT